MKLDILVETGRKLLGRQRLLESMIQQHAKTSGPVASQLPRNPLDHHLRSAAEFRHLNVQLLDKSFRQELTSFLTCLGGQNIDEFVKRIFFAVFDDEITLYVNFKGRKTKESLCGSKLFNRLDLLLLLLKNARLEKNEKHHPISFTRPSLHAEVCVLAVALSSALPKFTAWPDGTSFSRWMYQIPRLSCPLTESNGSSTENDGSMGVDLSSLA
nr:unnamed protein product [Spirometra erinaceieuropaei]